MFRIVWISVHFYAFFLWFLNYCLILVRLWGLRVVIRVNDHFHYWFFFQELILIKNISKFSIRLEKAHSGTNDHSSDISGKTAHNMDNRDTSVIYEANVLKPSVRVAPSYSNREDEPRGQECEKDISINFDTLADRPRGDHRHFHAEREEVNELKVVFMAVIYSSEVVLSKEPSLRIIGKAVTHEEEGQRRHWDDQDSFQKNGLVVLHLDWPSFSHHVTNLCHNDHQGADENPNFVC